MQTDVVICGDCTVILGKIPDNSISLIVTSPPYNKQKLNPPKNSTWTGDKSMKIDYDVWGDDLPEEQYQEWQRKILDECVRILKPDGSIFYNHKPRRIDGRIVMPTEWMRGLDLYQVIVWNRKNSPQINNFCFLPICEYIYWLVKPGCKPKFRRDKCKYTSEIWDLPVRMNNPHPAPFPIELPVNCVLGCTDENDVVLDPFCGSGTTLLAARQFNRRYVGIEISTEYVKMAENNLAKTPDSLNKFGVET